MRNKNIIEIAYLAAFVSLMFIMAWVPFLGFIPLGFASVTILHIPVLIAILFLGKKIGVLVGLSFGVLSWLLAMVRPTQPLDPFFVNPIISVLPRLLFAVFTVMIYAGIKKILKNEVLGMIITSVLGTLIHSILVLVLLVIIYFPEVTDQGTIRAAATLALTTLATSSTLEAIAAAIIAPAVVKALMVVDNKYGGQLKID